MLISVHLLPACHVADINVLECVIVYQHLNNGRVKLSEKLAWPMGCHGVCMFTFQRG